MPFANNDGIKIFYDSVGEGLPLVLLHGITDSHEAWSELGYVDALKGDFRLILIDARGHGQSEKPHSPEAYTLHVMASNIVAVLDALDVAKAHFFGYSMGGKIGFALADYYPERIASFVIGGSAPDSGLVQVVNGNDPWIERLSQGPTIIPSLWDEELPESLRERLVKNDTDALIAVRKGRLIPSDRTAETQTMPVPCLLLVGEADPGFAAVQRMAASLPHTQLILFPGLNHAGTFFSVNLLAPKIREFLERIPI